MFLPFLEMLLHIFVTENSLTDMFFLFWQANFARAIASLSKAQTKKVARFLPNPERHWGPKLRAGRQITSKHISLLGPDAVNGVLNHEEDEEHNAKRQKIEDHPTPNWWNERFKYVNQVDLELHTAVTKRTYIILLPLNF